MVKKIFWLIWLVGFSCIGTCSSSEQVLGNYFNVKNFGAIGDGITDDTMAFEAMWKAACVATGDVNIFVPKATYLIGHVEFRGPCTDARSITFNLQGHLKEATTDLSEYSDNWIEFAWVDRLSLIGGGTIDGQGSKSWQYNTCPMNKNCKLLPISLKFSECTNTIMRSITSLDSKFFHIALLDCNNFTGSQLKINAPEDSPNTDGIHIERSSNVDISRSVIRTGDDCVSIGHGNSGISITNVACGPGHGISVGSLGKYPYEKDVKGVVVRNCVLTGTQNGLRIKTWPDSLSSIKVTNMTFNNIVMRNVSNPIIIDQQYCPFKSCTNTVPSRVEISNILFKNIRGTSMSPDAVVLDCSQTVPCRNIKIEDVHLNVTGGKETFSSCENAQVQYFGMQIPPPCMS